MITFNSSAQALLLVAALSMDAFVSTFSYGTNKIEIPFKSVAVISAVCSGILAASLFFGAIFRSFIPQNAAQIICFTILFILGLVKIFDSTVKTVIRKYNKLDKKIRFSVFSLNFILNIYANPQEADFDASRTLSSAEAAYLAVALSLDGLAVGFGAGLTNINPTEVVLFSLISTLLAVKSGCFAGNIIAEKSRLELSWLSGLLLVALAVAKLA